MFVVRNTADNSQFWNNDEGWVGPEDATRFTEEERNNLNLPLDGEWIPAPKTITRYYIQGEKNTVADRAASDSIDNVIVEMTFPNEEAQRWFSLGGPPMSFKIKLKPETIERLAARRREQRARDRVARKQRWTAKIAEYRAKGWHEDADAEEACLQEWLDTL